MKVFSGIAWIFSSPNHWRSDFYVVDWMSFTTSIMKAAAMSHIDYTPYLPDSLAFLSNGLNVIYFVFTVILHMHFCILFVMAALQKDAAMDVITSNISMLIIHCFGLFVATYFQFNREKFARIVQFMNSQFRYRSAHGLTYATAERSYLVAKRCSLAFTGSCLAATIQWLLWPWFVRELPVKVVYPMLDQTVHTFPRSSAICHFLYRYTSHTHTQAYPYYEILYLLHSWGQLSIALLFGAAAAIQASVVINACGQFDISLCSLKNIRATALTKNGHQVKVLR